MRLFAKVRRTRTLVPILKHVLALSRAQCAAGRGRCTCVQRLRCFRGIDDLTALTIAAELGDPRRFPTAPSTMAFVRLVPSDASGTHRARGGITKTGNAHLRRVLVEAA